LFFAITTNCNPTDKLAQIAREPIDRQPLPHIFKIIVIGPSGAGKSNALRCMVDNLEGLSHGGSTVGIEFMEHTERYGDRWYRFQIWDTAGQERFAPIVTPFFRDAHAVIVVLDLHEILVNFAKMVTTDSSLTNGARAMNWEQIAEAAAFAQLTKIMKEPWNAPRSPAKMAFDGFCEPAKPVMVCMGNKIDLLVSNRMEYQDCALRNSLKRLTQELYGGVYLDTSVKTGENVRAAFIAAMHGVIHRVEAHIAAKGEPAPTVVSINKDRDFANVYMQRDGTVNLGALVRPSRSGGSNDDSDNSDRDREPTYQCKLGGLMTVLRASMSRD